MQAALCRGHHKGLVFNGSGAQQHFPMFLTGGMGESAGHQQHVCPISRILSVQLGEAQVVADAHTDAPALAGVIGHLKLSRLMAAQQHARLIKRLLPVVKLEKMNLVVARHTLPTGRKRQRGVVHAAAIFWAAVCCITAGLVN